MAAPSTPRRWTFLSGAIATVVALSGLLAFWALTAPALATIDEPRHFNSVLRIMQGGGWPPPYTAKLTEGTLVAMQESGHPYSTVPEIEPPAPEDRTVVVPLSGTEYEGVTGRDWMNQHPPTYYAIVAGILTAVGGADWRWDQLLTGMRLVSIAMVAGAAVFVLASVRRMSGNAAATIVGGLAIISVPQFFNVLSLVTNDALAVLASSGFLYFLVRAWRTPTDEPRRVVYAALGAGALLGLGLLTKGTMLAAIPVVFFTLLVIGLRQRAGWLMRLAPVAAAMAVAFAVGGWWYLRNILVYGEIQASNGGTGRNPVAAEGYDLGDFVRSSFAQLADSFWGSIRATLDLPTAMVVVLLLATVAAFLVTLIASPDRGFIALLLILPACVGGLILFHAWEVYWNENRLAGVQGRYFFGGITILCLVVALAWQILVRRTAGWVRGATAAVLGIAFLAIGAWGTRFAFTQRWGSADGAGQALEDAAAAGPFGVPALVAVAIIVVVAGVVAVAASTACATTTASPAPDARALDISAETENA